jgi:GNAT superfamily N-acetyltransferase
MSVEVRPATPGDAELMHRVSRQAWHGTVAANSTLFDETVEYVAAILSRGGGFMLSVDGECAGSVRHFPCASDPSVWEVKRLGVLAALRRRGLGMRLMTAVEDAARRAGVHALQIGIRADQPRLIRYYENLGFELDDSVRLSSQNPNTTPAVTMSKRLTRRSGGADAVK